MKKCKVCDTEISNRRVYCSDKCKEKFRYDTNLLRKRCKICDRKFIGKKGESVCSKECSLKAQRKYEKTCPICNKTFNSRGNGIYCSEVCYRVANDKAKGLEVSTCEVCKISYKKLKTSKSCTCSDVCSSNLFLTYINNVNQAVFGTKDPDIIKKFLSDKRGMNEQQD